MFNWFMYYNMFNVNCDNNNISLPIPMTYYLNNLPNICW